MGFRTVFAELDAAVSAGVIARYALGGAVAATFYIEPAATEDIDVFVVLDPAPGRLLVTLDAVFEFLTARGAQVVGEHLVIGGWPVQFLPASTALERDALQEARSVDVDGQSVRVVTAEHLAAIALHTARPKDKLRLQQFLEWKDFNRQRFDALVAEFGLGAKWTDYRARFLSGSP